jgi:predicted nucleotide-binding protein
LTRLEAEFIRSVRKAAADWSPSVFIGSSSGALPAAKRVKIALLGSRGRPRRVRLWTDPDVFLLSKTILTTLVAESKGSDFGVLVGGADDKILRKQLSPKGKTESHGKASSRGNRLANGEVREVIRDNVIFEFGLFSGALGLDRSFLLVPWHEKPKLPVDVDGMIHLEYRLDQMAPAVRRLKLQLSRVERSVRIHAVKSSRDFVRSPVFASARNLHDIAQTIMDMVDRLDIELDRDGTPFTDFARLRRKSLLELKILERRLIRDLAYFGVRKEGRALFAAVRRALDLAPDPARMNDRLLLALLSPAKRRSKSLRPASQGRGATDPGWRIGVDESARSIQRFIKAYLRWARVVRSPIISSLLELTLAVGRAMERKVAERVDHANLRLGLSLWRQFALVDGGQAISLSLALRPSEVIPRRTAIGSD